MFTGPTSTQLNKFYFKIRSHGTIHTFKNYFVTVFSVFSNKRYPNKSSGSVYFCQLILLFSLFLILFMSLIALFDTIHGSHYTISTNFYLYLQYFQQKVFSFNKINESQIDFKLFSNEHLVPFLFFVVIFKKMFWIHSTK